MDEDNIYELECYATRNQVKSGSLDANTDSQFPNFILLHTNEEITRPLLTLVLKSASVSKLRLMISSSVCNKIRPYASNGTMRTNEDDNSVQ